MKYCKDCKWHKGSWFGKLFNWYIEGESYCNYHKINSPSVSMITGNKDAIWCYHMRNPDLCILDVEGCGKEAKFYKEAK